MDISKEICNLIPLVTVFISGLFGLGVAVTTSILTNKRERRKFDIELLKSDLKDKENLYVSLLASLDKVIKTTRANEKYNHLLDEVTSNSARINLVAPDNINKQVEIVSNELYKWSTLYKKSNPKMLEDTGFGMVSNENMKYRKKADMVFNILKEEIQKLILEIKTELNASRGKVYRKKKSTKHTSDNSPRMI